MKAKSVLLHLDSRVLRVLVSKENGLFSLPSLELENTTLLSPRENSQTQMLVVQRAALYDNLIWADISSIPCFKGSDGAVVCEAIGKLWNLEDNSVVELPDFICKKNFNYESITFYGGSFNPWHEGHDECLKKCPSSNIVIVPDSSPWKKNTFNKCYFKEFMSLCFRLKETPYSIFPGFFGLEQSNPTSCWITGVTAQRISFLMGDDNFKSIFSWKEPRVFLNALSDIYILSRNYKTSELEDVAKEVTSFNSNLSIHYLGDHEFMEMSSTKLRDK